MSVVAIHVSTVALLEGRDRQVRLRRRRGIIPILDEILCSSTIHQWVYLSLGNEWFQSVTLPVVIIRQWRIIDALRFFVPQLTAMYTSVLQFYHCS